MIESRQASEAQQRRAGSRTKVIIAGAIILAVMGWLLYCNLQASTAHYLTTGELMDGGPSDRMVRVSGIVGQTIEWDPQQMLLRFEIADEGGSLSLVSRRPVSLPSRPINWEY